MAYLTKHKPASYTTQSTARVLQPNLSPKAHVDVLCRPGPVHTCRMRRMWSSGAKLCTYHQPSQFRGVRDYDLPLSITRLRAIIQFSMGSHGLPIEQGRFVRPRLPRHLRWCALCSTLPVGDERHHLFECPELHMARAQYSSLFQDARGSMRSLVWHKNQAAVSQFLAPYRVAKPEEFGEY